MDFFDMKPKERKHIEESFFNCSSIFLNRRQLCDLELILNGGFDPLDGFMNRDNYESVLEKMRLKEGFIWPIPITLDVSKPIVRALEKEARIALRDEEGFLLAGMVIEDIWEANPAREARMVYGSEDMNHSGVQYLYQNTGTHYVGGKLLGARLPRHSDFIKYRHTPKELKQKFREFGWSQIVAFQTRNPLHQAHVELTRRAAEEVSANILIHPVVGMTRPGDIDHYSRVRCYQHALKYYPHSSAYLSLLPLAMRMAGPREALWHAVIRKNYGCTHFIVGRDHAGPGLDLKGRPFYDPYAAQDLLQRHEKELGIQMVPFKEVVYTKKGKRYCTVEELSSPDEILRISGTQFREMLDSGDEIPEWFSFPEVIQELRKGTPPKVNRGFVVFFTGLPSSGKSTLAKALVEKLLETGARPVTLLDGDVVRQHLSSELGFSKEHRDLNVTRIGFVASEIARHRGIAVCAPIAPYTKAREENRSLISGYGGYIEVHVSTPLEICEKRDPKGLYAKARAGLIKGFTGIDDPYEEPVSPEIRIDTSNLPPEEAANLILEYLEAEGYLNPVAMKITGFQNR